MIWEIYKKNVWVKIEKKKYDHQQEIVQIHQLCLTRVVCKFFSSFGVLHHNF